MPVSWGMVAEWPGSNEQGGCGRMATQETQGSSYVPPSEEVLWNLTSGMALPEILLQVISHILDIAFLYLHVTIKEWCSYICCFYWSVIQGKRILGEADVIVPALKCTCDVAKEKPSCHWHQRSLPSHHTGAQIRITWLQLKASMWQVSGIPRLCVGCSTLQEASCPIRTHFLREVWGFSEVLKKISDREGWGGPAARDREHVLKNRGRAMMPNPTTVEQ